MPPTVWSATVDGMVELRGLTRGQSMLKNRSKNRGDRAGRDQTQGLTVAGVTVVVAAALAPPAGAIIGGNDATEDYPFIVTLRDGNGVHYCGGTLVAPAWVVTAGRCSHIPVKDVAVKVGGADVETGGSERGGTKVVRHPRNTANPNNQHNDIALLELDRPVEQAPIKIAARSS